MRFHGFVDRNYVTLGQDFVVSFSFTNTGAATRTISAKILCETVLYTGVRDRIVKQQSYQLPVSPRSSLLLHTNIVYYVISCCLIQFSISLKITYIYRIKARKFTPQIDAQITGFFVYSRKNKGLIMTNSLLINFFIQKVHLYIFL